MVRNRYALIAGLLIFVGSISPHIAMGEILDPTAEVLEFHNIVSPLSTEQLGKIALAFSAVPEVNRVEYLERIDEIITGVKDSMDPKLNPYELAEYILEYLHENVFTRYVEPQTLLSVTIDTGAYNCVSSSVLYMIVGRAFDLPIYGTVTPDHAFCSVRIDTRTIDIETTSRFGFDPGRKKEFHDEFGNLTGYSYVPPTSHGGRTDADERELVALILHNRISDLDSRGRYREALDLAVDRHAFLETSGSLTDLDREIGNYVAMLNVQSNFSDALELLERAFASFGVRQNLLNVYAGISNNRIVSLVNDGFYFEARIDLGFRRGSGYLDDRSLEKLEIMVVRHELANVLPTLDIDDAFAYIETVMSNIPVPESTYREFLINLYIRLSEETVEVSGYLAAADIIEKATDELGQDRILDRAYSVYRHNYAVVTHNRFAERFNARDFAEALRIVTEALQHTPESDILADDLRAVRSAVESNNR